MATKYPFVKLPHPFLTVYRVEAAPHTSPDKLNLILDTQPEEGQPLPFDLHNANLIFYDPKIQPSSQQPPANDNSPWARARRSPATSLEWTGSSSPSLAQIWNVVHAIFLAHPAFEIFRLTLSGDGANAIRSELLVTGLGMAHPTAKPAQLANDVNEASFENEILILRSAFWQGAASPAGARPIWAVGSGTDGALRRPLTQYPPMPENYQITNRFPEEPVYTRHPLRRPKPQPGSIVYSRYIPEVDEHFALEAVDWEDKTHLELFNKWQNDPRVAAGWNETGSIEHHRQYLRKLHFDPHVLCLFGRFDDSRFAYFELYWSKVDLTLFE